MFAVKADLSVSISPADFVTADIERLCRKRKEVFPVFLKKLRDHGPLFIVGLSCFFHMLVKKRAIVFFDIMVCRYRNEQVSSGRPYFVFDIPFFMSGIRVAETDLETIVGAETRKQFRFVDLIHNPAANTGCVVEDQKSRNTAYIIKDIHKSLADTLCCLAAKHLVETIVAIGK